MLFLPKQLALSLVFGLLFLFTVMPSHTSDITLPTMRLVDPTQLACLAKNIFFEARGEEIRGQAAVARVVMNRVNHGFGETPCNVVYQSAHVIQMDSDGVSKKVRSCQFAWVCEGKRDPDRNNPKYQQAEMIAYEVLAYDKYDEVIPESVLFFHNLSVAPRIAYKHVVRIGNHVFYSRGKKRKE